MLERYFIRPVTIDRIRACWIGDAIERYITWMAENGYAPRNVFFRVPVLLRFGEFAQAAGASCWDELPTYAEPFVDRWLKQHGAAGWTQSKIRVSARPLRNAIRQLLHLIVQYRHHLRRLEDHLRLAGIPSVADLSPAVITSFVTKAGKSHEPRSVQSLCSILKTFLRYLHQIGIHTRDLSQMVEAPRRYRLAELPRSISQEQVQHMLNAVDRRSPTGKRDYAILLLLATYGLRAREAAALRLEDIDWQHDRLHVRGRKAGHSAVYPLVPA